MSESKREEEEALFSHLIEIFKEISKKYNKNFAQIGEVFIKVSGNVKALYEYFEGKKVVEWTSLEDMALKKATNSIEYQCLLKTKGPQEIEIRKAFLSDYVQN